MEFARGETGLWPGDSLLFGRGNMGGLFGRGHHFDCDISAFSCDLFSNRKTKSPTKKVTEAGEKVVLSFLLFLFFLSTMDTHTVDRIRKRNHSTATLCVGS